MYLFNMYYPYFNINLLGLKFYEENAIMMSQSYNNSWFNFLPCFFYYYLIKQTFKTIVLSWIMNPKLEYAFNAISYLLSPLLLSYLINLLILVFDCFLLCHNNEIYLFDNMDKDASTQNK